MLELLRNGRAPAAILLGTVDAILVLGVFVARELGYETIPVVELSPDQMASLPSGGRVRVSDGGVVGLTP
jgi:predicted aconitase with swiveling domain